MTTLFAISKAVTRRGWVKLSKNRADLQRAIGSLRAPKEERKQRRRQNNPTRIATEHIEDQPPPEVQPGGNAVPLINIDSLPAQSGAEQSSGGGSTSPGDE